MMRTQFPQSSRSLHRLSVPAVMLVAILSFVSAIESVSQAQVTSAIVSDGTLGTIVARDPLNAPNLYEINGGTPRGTNLFHSFDRFTVGTGDVASFNGPGGITNILSRVTGLQSGLQQSIIDGTLQSTIPGANLFLMNPAGVLFGPNASLNVGGSVTLTTADYLRLNDGVRFEAIPGATDALLSSAPVAAFGFLGPTPAAGITVLGSTLQVPITLDPETGQSRGNTLSLIGGNISVVADPETGTPVSLLAPSGRIDLVSVTSPGEVLYPSLQTGPNINGQSFTAMGTVSLTEGAFLDASDNAFEAEGRPGTIRIRGGELVMDSALVASINQGDMNGAMTAVDVEVTGDVSLNNFSFIFSQAVAAGRSGDLNLRAQNVLVEGISGIGTFTDGDGQAGNVNIALTGSTLTVRGADDFGNFSNIQSSSSGLNASVRPGDSGAITISNASVYLDGGGRIQTNTSSQGRAGDINLLDVKDVSITGGAAIETMGSLLGVTLPPGDPRGSTGTITITATDKVSIIGIGSDQSIPASQQSRIWNNQQGVGGNGSVSLHATEVLLTDGGRIISDAGAEAGSVTVTADNLIMISNGGTLSSRAFSANVGPVELSAPIITIADQGSVTTRTVGNGSGGPISLSGQTITLSGNSEVVSSTEQGAGQGGQVELSASDSVFLSGGSLVASSSLNLATGPAGPVTVSAGNLVSLTGAGTGILSETNGSGNGGGISVRGNQVRIVDGATMSAKSSGTGDAGSITLTTTGNTVTMAGGSRISSSSTGTMANAGDAGSVTINAGNLFQSSGSTVATSAAQGQGGNITITASQEATLNNGTNISASSSGQGDAGNITINAGGKFFSENSSVTTQATQAGGGDISVMAGDMVRLINSQINTSVAGGEGGGGNITIDPNFVILQNSQILAQAFAGQGGNITITTGTFLPDANSLVDASSQFGLSGTVTIQSPTSNLSAVWARLQQNYTEAAALLRARCAAQVSGQYSSFVQTGRDAIPLEPGGWLLSPMAALSAGEGPGARSEGARSVVASSVLASEGGIPSLRGFDRDISWPGLRQAPRRFVSILDSACGS